MSIACSDGHRSPFRRVLVVFSSSSFILASVPGNLVFIVLSWVPSCLLFVIHLLCGVSSLGFFFFLLFLLYLFYWLLPSSSLLWFSLLPLQLLVLLASPFSGVVVVVDPSTLISSSSLVCAGTCRSSPVLRLRSWLVCSLSCVDLPSGGRVSCDVPPISRRVLLLFCSFAWSTFLVNWRK